MNKIYKIKVQRIMKMEKASFNMSEKKQEAECRNQKAENTLYFLSRFLFFSRLQFEFDIFTFAEQVHFIMHFSFW